MTRQDAKSTESQNSSPGRGSVTNRNLAFTSSVKAWMLVHPVLFYVIMSSPAENRAGQQFHARSCRYHTRNSVSAILYTVRFSSSVNIISLSVLEMPICDVVGMMVPPVIVTSSKSTSSPTNGTPFPLFNPSIRVDFSGYQSSGS